MNVNQGFVSKCPLFNKKNRGNLMRGKIKHPYFRKSKSPVTPTNFSTSGISTNSSVNSSGSFRLRSISSTSFSTSSASDSVTNSDRSHMIIAICEGRGQSRGEVGIAALDIRRPELGLYQISDTQGFVKTITGLKILNPAEILVPITLADSRIVQMLEKQFKHININTVVRRWFDGNSGVQLINHLCLPAFANNLLNMQHKYYALSATSALIKYLENVKHVTFATRSLKVIILRTHEMTSIDWETAYRLELVTPTRGTNKMSCLLGILNRCITNGGARLLRANILQPSCIESVILKRLNAVEELIYSTDVLSSIKMILPKFQDVDYILTLCMKCPDSGNQRIAEMQLNYILILKSILNAIPALLQSIKGAKSLLFLEIKKTLEDLKYQKINDVILKIINQDSFPSKGHLGDMQRCFAIRSGINELLDFTRTIYSGLLDSTRDLVKHLADVYKLPFSLNNNVAKGFHIVMKLNPRQSINAVEDLPKEFINVTKHPQYLTMTTFKIIELNRRIKSTQKEIEMISNNIICNLLNEIREDTGSLYMLCESVAELDVVQTLAEIGSQPNYVKPKFSLYLAVENSRHPMLDYLSDTEPTGNDISATKDNNFNIITGPNMSGKSIYLKQIALLQIMAQIGSFVPAQKACFRITDYIFTKINFDDSIEHDASTFQLDIRETKLILESLTPKSLVIIDEFCRGTCHTDGCAMAWTLSENFVKKEAFVFLATHFLTLTKLSDVYFNVINWHMEAKEIIFENEVRLTYTHRLKPGITSIEKYGLAAARTSAMPRFVVQEATNLMQTLTPSVVTIEGLIPKIDPIEKLQYEIISAMRFLLWKNELTVKKLKEMILSYRKSSATTEVKRNIFGIGYSNENSNDVLLNNASDLVSHTSISNNSADEIPFIYEINNLSPNYMPLIPEICYSQTSASCENGIVLNNTTPVINFSNTTANKKPKQDVNKCDYQVQTNLINNVLATNEISNEAEKILMTPNNNKNIYTNETEIPENDELQNTHCTPIAQMDYFNLQTSSSNFSTEQALSSNSSVTSIIEFSQPRKSYIDYNGNTYQLLTSDNTPGSSQLENSNNNGHQKRILATDNKLQEKKMNKTRSVSSSDKSSSISFGPIFSFTRNSNQIKTQTSDFKKPITSYSPPMILKATAQSLRIKTGATLAETFQKYLQTSSSSSNSTAANNETTPDLNKNVDLNYKKISIEILKPKESTKSSSTSSIIQLFSDKNSEEYADIIKNIPKEEDSPSEIPSFKFVFRGNKFS